MTTKTKSVKTSKKKTRTTKKTTTPKLLKAAPKTKKFLLCNGKEISKVKHLADEMGQIDEAHYNQHVTEDRNDFANWIRYVFEDELLATSLEHAQDLMHARVEIYAKLVNELTKKR